MVGQVQANMRKTTKRRAPRIEYTSPNQLSLSGFGTPFHNQLDQTNRWLVLSNQIPWDDLVNMFNKRNPPKATGRPALNPRVLIGAVIIKHILSVDDRETIAQITENMYPAERDKLFNIFWGTVPITGNLLSMRHFSWISGSGWVRN